MHRSAAVFTVVSNTVMIRLMERFMRKLHSRNLRLNGMDMPFMSVVYGPRNCTAEAAVDFAEVVVVRCHAACQEAAAAAADTLEAS